MFEVFLVATAIKSAGVFLKTITSCLHSFFYPPKCLKCGLYLQDDQTTENRLESCLCTTCAGNGNSVIKIEPPFCTRCGVPFPKSHPANHVCGRCLSDPFKLGMIRSATEYSGVIKQAVPLLKYNSKLFLARRFEQLLFDSFLEHYLNSNIDIIMPIPLHRKRLKERGFNQAYLITRNFERLFCLKTGNSPSWEIDIQTLVRKRHTPSQTGFDTILRKRNVKDAFVVKTPEKMKGKSILLIDDVLTTGATCNEVARVLLKSGARQVDGLVLARA